MSAEVEDTPLNPRCQMSLRKPKDAKKCLISIKFQHLKPSKTHFSRIAQQVKNPVIRMVMGFRFVANDKYADIHTIDHYFKSATGLDGCLLAA